jgi:hypothetical protein
MSNRDIQPLQFACPRCEQIISLIFGEQDFKLSGASDIIKFDGPFNGSNPFVDLHLDFPVVFGEYKMGDTVYFRAINDIGPEHFSYLNADLNFLNHLHHKYGHMQRLVTQYKRNDLKTFKAVISDIDIPQIKLRSEKRQDVIAALYSATSIMSAPFTIHAHNEELTTKVPQMLQELHVECNIKTTEFVQKIIGNSFLKTLHFDCLSLYPKMLSLELPIRPALYFDYVDIKAKSRSPARVSSESFEASNNLYKDLAEVFSRQLVLVAGLNNLLKREDYDLFSESVRLNKKSDAIKDFSNLDKYSDVDLGRKMSAIDNPFYNVSSDALDTKLRNGIAHFKFEYVESTQLIRFFPRKEGMERKSVHELYFLEFMRKILLLFREVHSLNHVIKALHYYAIFILKVEV